MIRLNKRLSGLGVASRREADRWITAGRIKVNGVVVRELGLQVSMSDRIDVDGRPVAGQGKSGKASVVAMHKPPGVICSRNDPQGRDTVYDLLPGDMPHLGHVGRLDYNTEGLLLFTDDGDLSQLLLSPSSNVMRIYHVKIRGRLTPVAKRRLEAGIPLDGRPTRPVVVEKIPSKSKHDWLRLSLFEGKNRHIHRIMEAVGTSVTRLRRVSFGGVDLAGIKLGTWRRLSHREVRELRGVAEGRDPDAVTFS